MDKFQKRRDDYVKPVQLSDNLKKIDNKLQEIIWAHAQIKQLERLPSTIVVDEVRTSLMEIVTGITCINSINVSEDEPLGQTKASLQASKPAKSEFSTFEILSKTIKIFEYVSGWRAHLIVLLLSDALKYAPKDVPDVLTGLD